MNTDRKRELKNAYKSRRRIGGVCCIRCSSSQRVLLQTTPDVESLRNRFEFGASMGSCPDPSLRNEWRRYGTEAFSFEVLEEIEKGEEQTEKAFWDDINVLGEMWREKLGQTGQNEGSL